MFALLAAAPWDVVFFFFMFYVNVYRLYGGESRPCATKQTQSGEIFALFTLELQQALSWHKTGLSGGERGRGRVGNLQVLHREGVWGKKRALRAIITEGWATPGARLKAC